MEVGGREGLFFCFACGREGGGGQAKWGGGGHWRPKWGLGRHPRGDWAEVRVAGPVVVVGVMAWLFDISY